MAIKASSKKTQPKILPKFDIISPDGFPIHYEDVYDTLEEAEEAFKEWARRYEQQGYYSSVDHGRIPLDQLRSYCTTRPIEQTNPARRKKNK